MTIEMNQLPASVREYVAEKNVLITGGLGFIGSNLAHALVELGAHVTILDALLPPYGGNLFNVEDIKDQVSLVDGDIRDQELMARLVKDKDLIFNLAGQVSYIDAKDQPFIDLDFNGRGHLNVLEAIRATGSKAKVLFSSSRLVYGRIKALPVREDHPTDPLSLYGIHKLLGEKYYRYYADTFDIPTVSIRIPNPYGPRQQMKHNKYSIVGWFVRQAMENQTLTIFGDGTQERDYLYIDDIVTAFLQLAAAGKSGEVYNVGTHERVSFVDMVDAVLKEVGTGKKEHVPWPKNYEKNETGNYIADTSKIEADTGWKAQVPLTEGVKEMVEYYKKHHKKYW